MGWLGGEIEHVLFLNKFSYYNVVTCSPTHPRGFVLLVETFWILFKQLVQINVPELL